MALNNHKALSPRNPKAPNEAVAGLSIAGKAINFSQRPLRAVVYRCLAVFSFTLMWIFVKIANQQGVNTVELIFYRMAFAVPTLVIVIALGPGLAGIKVNDYKVHLRRIAIGMG